MSAPEFTPNQRSMLFLLGIGALAERTGSDTETAADQLDGYAMEISGDAHDVLLIVGDEILVRAPRAWLAEIDGGC